MSSNCSAIACQQFCSNFTHQGHPLPLTQYKECGQACTSNKCTDFCQSLEPDHVEECKKQCKEACQFKLNLKKRFKFTPQKPIVYMSIAAVIILVLLVLSKRKK